MIRKGKTKVHPINPIKRSTMNDQRSTPNRSTGPKCACGLYPVRLYIDLTFIFCCEITALGFQPSAHQSYQIIRRSANDKARKKDGSKNLKPRRCGKRNKTSAPGSSLCLTPEARMRSSIVEMLFLGVIAYRWRLKGGTVARSEGPLITSRKLSSPLI